MFNYSDIDLERMITINKFEKTILDLFSKGKIRGTTHTSIGQEYIPVSMREFMLENDFVISNHRGHGHYISLTGDVEGLLCEIMGKEGAVCSCYGGSQQLYAGNFMTLGIQGEGVSIGTGIAWTFKHEKNPNICYVYVGDGTWGRGSMYESLNMASLYKLPLVIITENNGIAMTTPISDNMAGNIENRAHAFDVDYIQVTSQDISEIRSQLADKIKAVREGAKPLVIEFITQRLAAHSKGDDTRTEEEIKLNAEKSWYYRFKKEDPERLRAVEETVDKKMNGILNKVMEKSEEGNLLYEE